jgi:biopolymer transport protein TolQ
MSSKVAVPTPSVGAAEIAGSVAKGGSVPDMSILGMFAQADLVVKSVMLLLLFASFWCWAIVFDKFLLYRSVRMRTSGFEKAFWSGELLEELYERIKNVADHPMALIFVAAMHEWKMHATSRKDQTLKVGIKERIFQSMVLIKNQQMDKLEKNISFLATVGSTAPFVGLFGTVWGIMHSFTSIAAMQNVTLAVVAPGIAEALLATAIGLFAAIPAVIFYNKFTNDLASINNRLDDFASEFGSILSRELDKY